MNIKEAIEYGINLIRENEIDNSNLKARILLSLVLDVKKEYLLTHDLEEISNIDFTRYEECLNRLIDNEPIQYITQKQEFYKMDFFVNRSVLIPQPDTEILVEEVISICNLISTNKEQNLHILDLCTGSGAIGIAIAANIKNCSITLSDISYNALQVTKQNLLKLETYTNSTNKIDVLQSDLFENINNKFDIIVSNPPYIKTEVIKTLPKEVQKEPILALDGGKDGLDIYRRIINEGYKYLNEDGFLCLEIGYDQKEEVINILKKSEKYKEIYSKKDLEGNDRIIICKRRD